MNFLQQVEIRSDFVSSYYYIPHFFIMTFTRPNLKVTVNSKITFKLVLAKSFSQNLSDLMLKILLPPLIEKPFMCLL